MKLIVPILLFAASLSVKAEIKSEADLQKSYSNILSQTANTTNCFSTAFIPNQADCASIKNALALAKLSYLDDRKTFIEVTSKAIESAKSLHRESYAPILIAAISGQSEFLNPLQAALESEKAMSLKHFFAKAAIERLSSGKCKPETFSDKATSEVCRYRDFEFERIGWM